MDMLGLKREYKRAKKTKMLSIRVEPETYNWLRKKNYSPTRIFDDAMLSLKKKRKKKR